jgi:CRISPR/Cas system-associated exonuclease Cas4 (RecB family)
LVNENLPFAGTIDRVYRIDGKIVVLDIKTGNEYNPQHMIQLEMYAQLFESEFGVTVDYLADLYLKEWRSEKSKYLLRKHKRNPEAVETTMRMYSLMNENKGPVRRMEIPPSIRREDEKDN